MFAQKIVLTLRSFIMKRYKVILNKSYEIHIDANNDHIAIRNALEAARLDDYMDNVKILTVDQIS